MVVKYVMTRSGTHESRVSVAGRSGIRGVMAKDHGPSIQNDEQYEALRGDGMSKEKAARIANTPDASEKGGQSSPYEEWTKDELYGRAQELDVDGRSDMTKDQLIAALRED